MYFIGDGRLRRGTQEIAHAARDDQRASRGRELLGLLEDLDSPPGPRQEGCSKESCGRAADDRNVAFAGSCRSLFY